MCEITDVCSAGPGSGGRGLPMSFTCRPGRRPCSRGRAAPSRRPSVPPTCSASSAPGPGIHLTARGDGPRVKMKTSTGEIYPRLWQACPLGWSQPQPTAGGCYLRWGLAQRRSLPGSTDKVGRCLCTEPAGGAGGPTGSIARLMSAPARPPGSSSACPTPRRHWPCCLQSENRRTLSLESCEFLTCSGVLLKRQLIFTSQTFLLGFKK